MTEYIGKKYDSFREIPQEVIDNDELSIVSLGVGDGFKIISADDWEFER